MHKEFDFHLLNDKGKGKAMDIAAEFSFLMDKLEDLCPSGREFMIVRTKLEEACFFAKKAMASHPTNHLMKNKIE